MQLAEISLKRLHITWFHLYNILERQKSDEGEISAAREEED